MLSKILLIALAGAGGTLARYWLSGLVYSVLGRGFPWGTAVVNVFGSFLFGLIWILAENRMAINAETRTILLVGFMGAFTTFSTFIFESSALMTDLQWARLAVNVVGQVLVGLVALRLGFFFGRIL
ncbi:MAG: chromosome condensation protein CrcB [Deltaproteobacteria bacterium]|nr:chromosome condensation protein CrcB [Deltaproteobacteria bacterium]